MFDFLSRRYQRWRLYNRTVTELESLSNRDLADLGIAAVGTLLAAMAAAAR